MTDNFDLRDVLADRKYPTARIPVVLNDEVLWDFVELQRQAAEAVVDNAIDSEDVQRKLEAKIAERDASVYWIHLRGTSRRHREDIQSEVLSQIPYKPDMYGRDDVARSLKRQQLTTELLFASHITKIVAPNGAEQVFTEENKRDLTRAFLDEAPDHAVNIVDNAIAQLRGEEAEQFAKVSDLDFLSRT
jgi:hypothetical protein